MQAGSRAWVLRSSSSTQANRLHRLPQRQQRTVARAEGVQQSTSATCVATSSVDGSAYSRFTVSLKKPLGLILEEAADGSIRVAEVTPEGAAAKSDVRKGDQLLATTGAVYGKELDYQVQPSRHRVLHWQLCNESGPAVLPYGAGRKWLCAVRRGSNSGLRDPPVPLLCLLMQGVSVKADQQVVRLLVLGEVNGATRSPKDP